MCAATAVCFTASLGAAHASAETSTTDFDAAVTTTTIASSAGASTINPTSSLATTSTTSTRGTAFAMPKLDPSPVALSRGHADIGIVVDGRSLKIAVKDGRTQPAVWRPTDRVTFGVGPAARLNVPSNPEYAFLGQAGATVYVLPQTENATLPWLGWSTETIGPGVVSGNAVQMRLEGVDGPGSLALFFNDQFGGADVIFDSDDSSAPRVHTIAALTHGHANWAFSKAGTYRVRLGFSAAGVSSASTTVTIKIASLGTSASSTTMATPAMTSPGSNSVSTVSAAAQATASTSNGASGDLAATGSATAALGLAGVVCLGTGAVLLSVQRRRRISSLVDAP